MYANFSDSSWFDICATPKIGVVQLRRSRRNLYADERSSGMPHQVDFFLAKACTQVVGHHYRVRHKLLSCHCLWRSVWIVRKPGASLFPPDHSELLVEPGGAALREEIVRHAAMEIEQHGIAGAPAFDKHSLLNTIDTDLDLL